MIRRTRTALLTLLALTAAAHAQNLIKNGSFENNSAGGSIFNMSNATFNTIVNDCTAFGGANEIDIMQGNPFGLPPVHGSYKLAIHRQAPMFGGAADEFSFDLTSSIVAGSTYTIDFWAHAETHQDPGVQPVDIGISSAANSFGTLVYTSGALSTNSWTNYAANFVAPVNAAYLTVRNSAGTETWAHIDDFSLTLVPAPGSLALLGAGALFTRRRRAA